MVTSGGSRPGDFSAPLFAVACPACGRSLAATTAAAGRAAACPCCRARFLLPVAAAITVPRTTPGPGDQPSGERRPPVVPPVDSEAAAAACPSEPVAVAAPPAAAVVASPAPSEPVVAAPDSVSIVGEPMPTFDIPAELFGHALAAAIVPPESRILDGEAARQMEVNVGERRARDRRRARRSLLMLVIGSAILLGIVFWFTGFGSRR